ncbi:DUF2059 domain-containing protein [Flavobacterium aciduliphilum]|uniref:DUF2059 domain-containing protein n=1 Tax=Flavobacterium aciduliphilum TaxID=1101402 RepID=A0A328YNC4_9FLAO|nr:DUF2059 domain-containing protein [Flavobacterium aciduliphilum]RAR71586.1 hypothetical protein CLV55_107143 [Flavobacterium aciduliphilum]
MKKLILTFAFLVVAQYGFSQAVDEAFKKDVMRVIERSGAGGQMASAKKQILSMIPEAKQAAFLVEFDALLPKIYETTAKIYMEEYTKEDIKAMLAFYDSPVGKKMADKAETIASKSQEAMMSLQGDIQALVMKYMQ